jgi:hypothetical protein
MVAVFSGSAGLGDGEDVEVDAPVSPRLLASLDRIMAVHRSMFPNEMRTIGVRAPAGQPPPPIDLTACYFSRGVDSWYAILTALEDDPQEPPLTHLVFSPGFLSVTNWTAERLRSRAQASLSAAAKRDAGW